MLHLERETERGPVCLLGGDHEATPEEAEPGTGG